MHPPSTRLLLSVEEAAEQLGVSRSTMYDLLRTRAVESVRIGRCRRIGTDDLRAYVEHLRVRSDDPATWARKAG